MHTHVHEQLPHPSKPSTLYSLSLGHMFRKIYSTKLHVLPNDSSSHLEKWSCSVFVNVTANQSFYKTWANLLLIVDSNLMKPVVWLQVYVFSLRLLETENHMGLQQNGGTWIKSHGHCSLGFSETGRWEVVEKSNLAFGFCLPGFKAQLCHFTRSLTI